ncbi:MAG TPA: TPM domain-containing protein [Chryseosolibacter sp.]
MRFLTLILFLLSAEVLCAQIHTVETVPNNKITNGSYVSDPDNLLRFETVAAIDRQLGLLEDSTTAQVSVVMLDSIGGADIFTFAQELFNQWGIGRSTNDNGLLILYAGDQRTIRFHTGDGLEAVLPDAVCKQIQRTYMVPRFKEGDVDAGMLAGIDAIVKIIQDPASAGDIVASDSTEEANYTGFMMAFFIFYGIFLGIVYFIKASNFKFRDSRGRSADTHPGLSLTKRAWLITFGLVPSIIVGLFALMENDSEAMGLAIIALYLYFLFPLVWRLVRLQNVIKPLLQKKEYFEVTEIIKDGRLYWFFVGLVFPLPFFIYFFIHLYRTRYYRNYPRDCNACHSRMEKLSEKADDEFLPESAQMEEKLRSGNYDVWKCTSCNAVEMWFYKNSWSKYEACPKCKTLAFYTKSSRTLRSASYTSSGEGERTKACKFCHHTAVSTYSIPMLTRSESSSSSFSSSSSGGSWGGGSSSGGGASSSW